MPSIQSHNSNNNNNNIESTRTKNENKFFQVKKIYDGLQCFKHVLIDKIAPFELQRKNIFF